MALKLDYMVCEMGNRSIISSDNGKLVFNFQFTDNAKEKYHHQSWSIEDFKGDTPQELAKTFEDLAKTLSEIKELE